MHVNEVTGFCHVVIALQRCRQNVENLGRIIRIMQIALPQKAIIAKRNASPANLLIKPLIYMAFFLYPAWHADCIIDTDNQPTIQFG